MCRDHLSFEGGSYQWQTTDVVFTGEYSCQGVTVTGRGNGTHQGTIDVQAAQLTWEETTFVPDSDE